MNTLISFILLLFPFVFGFQCKNEQNEPVDWYVLYKLPKHPNHVDKLIQDGIAYLFITSQSVAKGWTLSNISINSTDSMPGLTLSPLYTNNSLLHILYNDEPPKGETSSTKGHTKGTLLSSNISALWLIHSVPHYPPPDKYLYPNTGVHFGQSFLCISLNTTVIDVVGKQLLYYQPNIYSYNIPESFKSMVPNLIDVVRNETIHSAPWYHLTDFFSTGNQSFTSFAKSNNFNKDLYVDWIAMELKSDLLVETWPNGPGRLHSSCQNPYSVNNIENIMIQKFNVDFKSTADHSKWAISNTTNKEDKNNWICIGDINRAEHQKKRGGGSVCFYHPVWIHYLNVINKIEKCHTNIYHENKKHYK